MIIFAFIQAYVTEEDGMESIAHRFLSAAVKVQGSSLFPVNLSRMYML